MDCNSVNIKKGSKGEKVKELQKYLKYYGYYASNIDGKCGDYTVSAIKKFQKNKSLSVDGVWGKLSCQASWINGHDVSSSTKEISLKIWKDIMSRYATFIKEKGREPNTLYIDKEYPYEFITLSKYKEMKTRYDTFISSNNREPNTMSITKKITTTTNTKSTKTVTTTTEKTTYTSSPHYENKGCNKMGQCTGYFCFPHSIRQILRKWNITKYSEKVLAGYCGTTSKGTSHQGGETCIAKIAQLEGIKLKVEWKNFSDLGNTRAERFKKLAELFSQQNIGIIVHLAYRNQFGHYEVNKTIDTKKEVITVLNSLGSKCNSPAYCGYLENRSYTDEASYIAKTTGGQPSICIITKV